MIISYHENQYRIRRRKRLIRLVVAAVAFALFLPVTTLLLLSFAWSASSFSPATQPASLAGTIAPTPRSLAASTETPIPTATPLAGTRVAKCKDEGVGGVVQPLAHWQVGETRTLRVTRYRQRFFRHKLKVIVQSVMDYHVKVLEAGPAGYTLEWVVTEAQVEKGGNTRELMADDVFLQDLLTLKPGLRLVYRTDINGAYQKLQNWEQVLAFHHQLRDIFTLRLEKVLFSKQARQRLQAALAPMWDDPSQIEQIYTQEIRAYHQLYGMQIGTNQLLLRTDHLPSLLGNTPLEARSEIKLLAFAPQSNCALLEMKRYLPPAATKQFLHDYLTRQTKLAAFTLPLQDSIITTKIEDGARYSLDMAGSWLPMAQVQRVTKVENLNMIDGIVVVDVTALPSAARQ